MVNVIEKDFTRLFSCPKSISAINHTSNDVSHDFVAKQIIVNPVSKFFIEIEIGIKRFFSNLVVCVLSHS